MSEQSSIINSVRFCNSSDSIDDTPSIFSFRNEIGKPIFENERLSSRLKFSIEKRIPGAFPKKILHSAFVPPIPIDYTSGMSENNKLETTLYRLEESPLQSPTKTDGFKFKLKLRKNSTGSQKSIGSSSGIKGSSSISPIVVSSSHNRKLSNDIDTAFPDHSNSVRATSSIKWKHSKNNRIRPHSFPPCMGPERSYHFSRHLDNKTSIVGGESSADKYELFSKQGRGMTLKGKPRKKTKSHKFMRRHSMNSSNGIDKSADRAQISSLKLDHIPIHKRMFGGLRSTSIFTKNQSSMYIGQDHGKGKSKKDIHQQQANVDQLVSRRNSLLRRLTRKTKDPEDKKIDRVFEKEDSVLKKTDVAPEKGDKGIEGANMISKKIANKNTLQALEAAHKPVQATKSSAAAAAAAAAAELSKKLSTVPVQHTNLQSATAASLPGYTPIAISLKSARSRQFLLNTPLGEFEVLKTLGQGSYGKVKLMRSALTNEQFAVKIIKRYPPHKHRRGHQEYRKAKTLDRRVVREANLASILGQLHPHIVPLHDFRVTDTHFYLFYSYVNGITLAERVGTNGINENEARAIFKPVAETIKFCHQYSVIHRDIKLENVLIDYANEAERARPLLTGSSLVLSKRSTSGNNPNSHAMSKRHDSHTTQQNQVASGNNHNGMHAKALEEMDYRTASVFDGSIKIIDFGLANFFDGESLMETFCGSLPYTAPEILRGDAYVGPEIDIWSLGVLLYVMLTGQFPFEDPAQSKNFDKIMAGDFLLHVDMSVELRELLVCMLEPDSKRRISMQEVLEHPWLSNKNSTGNDKRYYSTPRPGICCLIHRAPIIDAIHDRRTLLLPGPQINPVIAQEVSTCLDRSISEIMKALEVALENGESVARDSLLSMAQDGLLSNEPVLTWPGALQGGLDSTSFVRVPNSPVVSVYALIVQQIEMRKYYIDLPMTETIECPNNKRHSAMSKRFSLASQPSAKRMSRSGRAMFNRFSLNLGSAVTNRGGLKGSYAQIGMSMPVLPQPTANQHARIDEFSHGTAQEAVDFSVRNIGALEDISTRIVLPSELTSVSAKTVQGLISQLLTLHEIAHTFVEIRKMPVQKALGLSMFSLKTIAAMMAAASAQHWVDAPSQSASKDPANLSLYSLRQRFSKPNTAHGVATDPPHKKPLVRALLDRILSRPHVTEDLCAIDKRESLSPEGVKEPQQTDKANSSKSPSATRLQFDETSSEGRRINTPQIVTTVPVAHATPVMFAQYSPSLNRWKETEVVEYYSCSVRIELVRVGGTDLRHRYALLIDQMTGHKGKFVLFRMFMRRIVAALPSLNTK